MKLFDVSVHLALSIFATTYLALGYSRERTCPRVPEFSNGGVLKQRLQSGREEDPYGSPSLGNSLQFQCTSGFIIGNERWTTLSCRDQGQGPEWVSSTDPLAKGCTRGCLDQRDCDWGMHCDGSIRECMYLQCPENIPNAHIIFSQPILNRKVRAIIGQTATLSCFPGFFVQHPDEFVALARTGLQLKDNNVQVQCHQLENGHLDWVLMYRQSSGMMHSVYGDVLHRSMVTVQCLPGCLSDCGCPLTETCYERQCVPTVCPDSILGVPNSLLMMSKSAKVGSVVKARCDQGFVVQALGFNRPFDVLCTQPKDLRRSPEWILQDLQFQDLKCILRESCQEHEDCLGFSTKTRHCIEGKCVRDCMDVPDGQIVQERHISSKTGEESCVSDDEPSFSVGNSATLTCHPGYIIGNPIRAHSKFKVICAHDDIHGSRWRDSNDPNRLAECIRGCTDDLDCPSNHQCDPLSFKCQEFKCPHLNPMELHGTVQHKDPESFLLCDPGFVYFPKLGPVGNMTEIICQTGAGQPKWTESDGKQSVQSCSDGCMSDLGCGFGEFCDMDTFKCHPVTCPCASSDPNVLLDNCLGNPVEAFGSVTARCRPEYVFQMPHGLLISQLELICDPISQDLRMKSEQLKTLQESPPCVHGCLQDSDCQNGDWTCQEQMCMSNSCSKQALSDPNADYDIRKPHKQALKTCHKGFMLLDGSKLVPSLQLVCVGHEAQSWVPSHGSPSEPLCAPKCNNASPCADSRQSCSKGICQDTECAGSIVNGLVQPLKTDKLTDGTKAVLICSEGHIVDTDSGCQRQGTIECNAKGQQPFWKMLPNKDAPKSPLKCHQGCEDDAACGPMDFCDNSTCRCVPKSCLEPRQVMGGTIHGPENITIGMFGTLVCQPGYLFRDKSRALAAVRVQCLHSPFGPRFWLGSSPIQGCEEGCFVDEECSGDRMCRNFQCLASSCFLEDPNALLELRGPQTYIQYCQIGMVMSLNGKPVKSVEVECKIRGGSSKRWLTPVNGGDLSQCSAGCVEDRDCDRGRHCVQGKCSLIEPCSSARPINNGLITKVGDQRILHCHGGFALHNGNRDILVTCSSRRNNWVVRGDSPIPMCCKCPSVGSCRNHCTNECALDQLNTQGASIVAQFGNHLGATGLLACKDGYHLGSLCSKVANVTCAITQSLGPLWINSNRKELAPPCIIMDPGQCCHNNDCPMLQLCHNETCTDLTCSKELPNAQAHLKDTFRVKRGDRNEYKCKKGYHQPDKDQSRRILCQGTSPKWTDMSGNPILPCVPGCSGDEDCGLNEHCNLSQRKCHPAGRKSCPPFILHGVIVSSSNESLARLHCNPGYLAQPSSGKVLMCSEEGAWVDENKDSLVCKPGCSWEHLCPPSMACIQGSCIPSSMCPPGLPFSFGFILPTRAGLIGDEAEFYCNPNHDLYGNDGTKLDLKCTPSGWTPSGSVYPQCKLATEECPRFDPERQGYFVPASNTGRFVFQCLPGKMQANGQVQSQAVCRNQAWTTPKGLKLDACNSTLQCQADDKCPQLEHCVGSKCERKTCLPSFHLPNSQLLPGSSHETGSSALLVCHHGYIYDSEKGQSIMQELHCAFDPKSSKLKWMSMDTFTDPEDCIKGCTGNEDCDHECRAGQCHVASGGLELCTSPSSFNGKMSCQAEVCTLTCEDPLEVVFDPNLRPPLSRSLSISCTYKNGQGQWKTAKEEVVADPICVPKSCLDCGNQRCTLTSRCNEECSLDVMPSYVRPTMGTPSNSLQPNETVDLACQTPNERLITFKWNPEGTQMEYYQCIGKEMTTTCQRSHGSLTLQGFTPHDDLPQCAQECTSKDLCQCSSLDYCQESCSTCVPIAFEPCSTEQRCRSRANHCAINPRTSNMECLPNCSPYLDHGQVQTDSRGHHRVICDFHFAPSKHAQMKGFVKCSYTSCQPTWSLLFEQNEKPECQFEPNPCDKADLMFLPNAKVMFKDGQFVPHKRMISPQSGRVICNKYHLLEVLGKLVQYRGRLIKALDLECRPKEGTRQWLLPDGTTFHVGDLKCTEGCVQDSDCHREGEICDAHSNKCVRLPCPAKIDNGQVEHLAPSRGDLMASLQCDPGYALMYPQNVLQKAFAICQEKNMCGILSMRSSLVHCKKSNQGSGVWFLSLNLTRQALQIKTNEPAQCKKECVRSTDCSKGMTCVHLVPNCQTHCGPKVCIHTHCPQLPPTSKGFIKDSVFWCDQDHGVPGLGSGPTAVICQWNEVLEAMNWVYQNSGHPVVPCRRRCQSRESCSSHESCNKEGLCFPIQCTPSQSGGIVDRQSLARLGESAAFSCLPGHILYGDTQIMPGPSKVTCKLDRVHGARWTLDETSTAQPLCIPGCSNNRDCPEPMTCDLKSAQCTTPTCPDLFIENSDLRSPLTKAKVGSSFEVVCRKGFVIPNRLSAKLKCSMQSAGPVWTTQENRGVEHCIPGCNSCSDCQESEECFHNVCMPLSCSQYEVEGYRDLQCSQDDLSYSIGTVCNFKTNPGYLEGEKLSKRSRAKCIPTGGCKPNSRDKRSTWDIPETIPGCQIETQEEDCKAHEECSEPMGYACVPKTCDTGVVNGDIEGLGRRTANVTESNGQYGRMVCHPGYILGFDPSSTRQESKLSVDIPLATSDHVTCIYLNGSVPKWTNHVGLPLSCFQKCYATEDCPSEEACIQNRCVPEKCLLPQPSALMKPCSPSHEQVTQLPIGSGVRFCCQPGYVSHTSPKSKSFQVTCSKAIHGYPVLSTPNSGAPGCQKGCTKSTERQDCLRSEMCVENECVQQKCETEPRSHSQIKLSGDPGDVPIGTKGMLECRPGYIYPLPNGGHSHLAPIGCFRGHLGPKGQWSLLWHSDHPIQIQECVEGCILDEDCPRDGFCNSGLHCETKTCSTFVQELENSHLDINDRSISALGTIQCDDGFIHVSNGKVTKTKDVRCCSSGAWGEREDCSRIKFLCQPGCLPHIKGDCPNDEECIDYQCSSQACSNEDENSSLLRGRQFVVALNVGERADKLCYGGHLVNGTLGSVPVYCELDSLSREPILITKSHQRVEDCQKSCRTSADCALNTQQCLQGICASPCKVPRVKNSVPMRSRHVPLGTSTRFQCQPGYLTPNGQAEQNLTCSSSPSGPKLCSNLGDCLVPRCIEGCLSGSDCSKGEECVPNSQECFSSACCESIQCPLNYKPGSGLQVEHKLGRNVARMGDEATISCPLGMILRDPSGIHRWPQNFMEVICSHPNQKDSTVGHWLPELGDVTCSKGCNGEDVPCLDPCQFCQDSSWTCSPKVCSALLENAKIFGFNQAVGSKSHVLCDPRHYAKARNGTLLNITPIDCSCMNGNPTWMWNNPRPEAFPGCNKDFCLVDEDCEDRETCGPSGKCEGLVCSQNGTNLHGTLQVNQGGETILQCATGFLIPDINNGTLRNAIRVECVFKPGARKMAWVPIGHKECAIQDSVQCSKRCQKDSECSMDEMCSKVPGQTDVKQCLPKMCSKPYEQIHGELEDFPKDGLPEDGHVTFKCHPGHGIAPSKLSPFVRSELTIFCLSGTNLGSGIHLGYFLENGADVPLCQRGVCSKSSDCLPGEMCDKAGQCELPKCRNFSPVKYSRFLQPNEQHPVRSSSRVLCSEGRVMKAEGQCRRTLDLICLEDSSLKRGMWASLNGITLNLTSCEKGCISAEDCRYDENCDLTTCSCQRTQCPNQVSGGVLIGHSSLDEGQRGLIICPNDDPQPVTCTMKTRFQGEWRIVESKAMASCSQASVSCKADRDCNVPFKCLKGQCTEPSCPVTCLPEELTISDLMVDQVKIGEAIPTKCRSGQHFSDGTNIQPLYCVWQENGLKFDPLRNTAICVSGCTLDEDCSASETCLFGECYPKSCIEELSVEGGTIVPQSSVTIGSTGTLECSKGFIVQPEMKAKDLICSLDSDQIIPQWQDPGDKSILPHCVPGCLDDRDCPLTHTCSNTSQCVPKVCSNDMLEALNAALLPEDGPNMYLQKSSMVCKRGFRIPRSNETKVPIICQGDEVTPKWMTQNGDPLPKCLWPCSTSKDCSKSHICDAYLKVCFPQDCDPHVPMHYGQLIPVNSKLDHGALQVVQCNPGYVINPSLVNGELIFNVTVECRKNILTHEMEWRLLDGKNIPECIPGCGSSVDCGTTEACLAHKCEPLTCKYPSVDNALVQIDGSQSSFMCNAIALGASGKQVCDHGFYPQDQYHPSEVHFFCSKSETTSSGILLDQFGHELKACVRGCLRDDHCPARAPKCNFENGTCHECRQSKDCQGPNEICNDQGQCSTCPRSTFCISHGDCPQERPICNDQRNICVGCIQDDHCPMGQRCGPNEECQSPCRSNTQCSLDGHTPFCHPTREVCTECVQDAHCLEEEMCSKQGACHRECLIKDHCGRNEDCSNGMCAPKIGFCEENANCTRAKPVCDAQSRTCAECLVDEDCLSRQCVDRQCSIPEASKLTPGCRNDSDCGSATPVCDLSSGQCVECLQSSNCTNPRISQCVSATRTCSQCTTSDHCHAEQRCIPSQGQCRHVCSSSEQCSKGEKCSQGHCFWACSKDQECPHGLVCHPEQRVCRQCVHSRQCSNVNPVCYRGDCVAQCSTLCPVGFCDPKQGLCRAECLHHEDCLGSSSRRLCHPGLLLCLQCVSDPDCPLGKICSQGECTIGCRSNSQCSAPRPICHQSTEDCVQCFGPTDCQLSAPYCNPKSHECEAFECSTDANCSQGLKCLSGKCQSGCRRDEECPLPMKVCHPLHHVCQECRTDPECPLDRPICVEGQCHQCLEPDDCPTGFHCLDHDCHEGCHRDSHCRTPEHPRCLERNATCVQCLHREDCPLQSPVCQDHACSDRCETDKDCPGRLVCVDAKCLEGCRRNADCSDAAPVCNLERSICTRCLDHKDCSKEFPFCRQNECFGNCATDIECPEGTTCQHGKCSEGCLSHANCRQPTGYCAMALQRCVECISNDSCPPHAPKCRDGTCSRECQADDECSSGAICAQARCIPGCRSNLECREPKPECDPRTGTCVECLERRDCSPLRPNCEQNQCQGCKADPDCVQSYYCGPQKECLKGCTTDINCPPASPKCHPEKHECTQCVDFVTCPRDHFCSPSGTCQTGCEKDDHCSRTRPRCELRSQTCQQCSLSSDCKHGEYCKDFTCTNACFADSDCLGALKHCPEATRKCSECHQDQHCSPGQYCKDFQCQTGCQVDGHCTGTVPFCDPLQRICVQCKGNGDCPSGFRCTQGTCSNQCQLDEECLEPSPYCDPEDGECVQCLEQFHCDSNSHCDGSKCRPGCIVDLNCPKSAPRCDATRRACVPCVFANDCQTGFFCSPSQECSNQCQLDSDCSPMGMVCSLDGTCVQCKQSRDCNNGFFCEQAICKPGCLADSECSNPTPMCDLDQNQCVQCLESRDCSHGLFCSSTQCTNQCQDDRDCLAEGHSFCHPNQLKCVQCRASNQCPIEHFCNDGNTCEDGCQVDAHCPQDRPRCDRQARKCVECSTSEDCPQGAYCSDHQCSIECRNSSDCLGTFRVCNRDLEKCVSCTMDEGCSTQEYCSDNTCISGCPNDQSCPPERPRCHPKARTCVPCLAHNDCEAGMYCHESLCRAQCLIDSDCLGSFKHCDQKRQKCVQCLASDHCPRAHFCAQNQCAIGCLSHSDCLANKPVCDAARSQCEECLKSSDCGPGKFCQSNQCVPGCSTDGDCGSSKPKCDFHRHTCEQCLTSPDCAPGSHCSDKTCLQGCQSNAHCFKAKPVCDMSQAQCVECLTTSDCSSSGSICESKTCQAGCLSNSDCSLTKPICDLSIPECVQCLESGQCPVGYHCSNWTCREGCQVNSDCPRAHPVCDVPQSECVQCLNGSQCSRGWRCQGRKCIEGCISDPECTPEKPICDTSRERCVECVDSHHCGQGSFCSLGNMCQPGCGTSQDCAKPSPICDTSLNQCIECLQVSDCSFGLNCLKNTCTSECRTDPDCSGTPKSPVCAQDLAKCVMCTLDSHCAPSQYCDDDHHCLVGCQDDAQCVSQSAPHCHSPTKACQECLASSHCQVGFYCQDFACIKGCEDSSNCPLTSPYCDTDKRVCHSVRRLPKYCRDQSQCFAPKPFCSADQQCVACITRFDCPTSRPMCSNGKCRECQGSKHCAKELVCRQGYCKPPNPACFVNKECPTIMPNCDKYLLKCIECFTQKDCAPQEFCNHGDCIPDDSHEGDISIYDKSCRRDSDCSRGLVCTNMQCSQVSGQCARDPDCPNSVPKCDPANRKCVECLDPKDCSSGYQCSALKTCQKAPQRCRTDRHCPKGLECRNRTCKSPRPPCFLNEDCPAAKAHCDKDLHQCVECFTNRDCGSKEFCDHGECIIV